MSIKEITVKEPYVDPTVANTMGVGKKKSSIVDEKVKNLEPAVDDTHSTLNQFYALVTQNKDEKTNTSDLPESVRKAKAKVDKIFQDIPDINFQDMDPGDIIAMLAAIQDLLQKYEQKSANMLLDLKGKEGVVAVKQLIEFVKKSNESTEKRFQAGEVGAAGDFASSLGGILKGYSGLGGIALSAAGYVLKSVQARLERDASYASTSAQFAQDMSQTQGKQESSSEQEFNSIKGDFQKALDEMARSITGALQSVNLR